ncbi:MAG TPA: hypothetical protein VFH51_13895, partial [Myxococcota bacterium]|nr:hypothetical protein [Myxococcota bacterium]
MFCEMHPEMADLNSLLEDLRREQIDVLGDSWRWLKPILASLVVAKPHAEGLDLEGTREALHFLTGTREFAVKTVPRPAGPAVSHPPTPPALTPAKRRADGPPEGEIRRTSPRPGAPSTQQAAVIQSMRVVLRWLAWQCEKLTELQRQQPETTGLGDVLQETRADAEVLHRVLQRLQTPPRAPS